VSSAVNFVFLQIHQVWQSLKKNVSAPERFVNRTKPEKGRKAKVARAQGGKPNAQGEKIYSMNNNRITGGPNIFVFLA
jgi:hypothetical protein